jgi:NAD(P)-dependent dehydrogenase (short-subunit alcohol dehydrogenase family)
LQRRRDAGAASADGGRLRAAHRHARLDPDRLDRPPSRSRFVDYARSKLANLLFAQELHHRLTAAGAGTEALAAHPGGARTNIVRYSDRLSSRFQRADPGWPRHLFQEPDVAALSVVRAATDPSARGGEFYGPDRPLGLTGGPALTRAAPRVYDRDLQRRLWTASEELTGVRYPLPDDG